MSREGRAGESIEEKSTGCLKREEQGKGAERGIEEGLALSFIVICVVSLPSSKGLRAQV
ncbi:hypothetical protein Sjap_021984 [Stephania japonica]|uniref:Uncharacterized protein n=1 Tax=Stephania japonica TaxID=461633 RepID=A0AAP0ER48_9MAGN